MRTIVSTFLCLLSLSTFCWSQGSGRVQHPAWPNATLVGTFRCQVTIGDGSSGSAAGDGRGILTEGKGFTVSQLVLFWSVSGGSDYTIDPDSLQFSGDGAWLDNNSAVTLFDLLAKTAVMQGITLGYTPCSASCGGGNSTIHVYQPSCVYRQGSGITTQFIPQDPGTLSMREYGICCPTGISSPQIQVILHEGTSCSGGVNGVQYEPTSL